MEIIATYVHDAEDGEYIDCWTSVQQSSKNGLWTVIACDDGYSEYISEHDTRDEAVRAAEAYASEHDAGGGVDAALLERRGMEDETGLYSCYYVTPSDDDAGPRGRYQTLDAAQAAAELANDELAQACPGGRLLVGFEPRRLVDGSWEPIDEDV